MNAKKILLFVLVAMLLTSCSANIYDAPSVLADVTNLLPDMGFTLMVLVLLTNAAKKRFPDVDGDVIYNWLSFIFITVLVVIKMIFPDISLLKFDNIASAIVDNVSAMLPTVLILLKLISPVLYDAVRGIPIIGYSRTLSST